jgi:uncharacterized repeat protein (TIGR02543 family)
MPDGSIKLKVFYTNNEEPSEFTINAARGVKNISTKLENNQYIITFTYTDGTTEEIAFYRPAAWLSGTGAPDPDAGIDGDFYFDIANKLIYQKYDGVWGNGKGGKDPLVDLTLQAITYTVTFVIGEDVRVAPGTKTEYSIKAGESFAAKKYSVPVPIHNNPDYEFLGWYTVDDEDLLTVNHSNFTDLTPISGDLTLYAHWKNFPN